MSKRTKTIRISKSFDQLLEDMQKALEKDFGKIPKTKITSLIARNALEGEIKLKRKKKKGF